MTSQDFRWKEIFLEGNLSCNKTKFHYNATQLTAISQFYRSHKNDFSAQTFNWNAPSIRQTPLPYSYQPIHFSACTECTSYLTTKIEKFRVPCSVSRRWFILFRKFRVRVHTTTCLHSIRTNEIQMLNWNSFRAAPWIYRVSYRNVGNVDVHWKLVFARKTAPIAPQQSAISEEKQQQQSLLVFIVCKTACFPHAGEKKNRVDHLAICGVAILFTPTYSMDDFDAVHYFLTPAAHLPTR